MRGSVVQKPKGTEQWYVVLDLEGQPAAVGESGIRAVAQDETRRMA